LCAGMPADLVVAGVYRQVTGYDPLNGTLQDLHAETANGETRIRAVLVKDYPLLLRFQV
jgi:hypothetical protein